MEAVRGTELEPLSDDECAEMLRLRKRVADQEKEIAFLGKASACFAAERFALMEAECANFEISHMAGFLEVSHTGFYRRRGSQYRSEAIPSSVSRSRFFARILFNHRNSDETYGVPQITADLRDEGILSPEKR